MNRALIAVLALLCACDAGEAMPQTLTTKVRGLWTSPNEHGEIPPGALSRADDVVLSRDGIAEKRPGQPVRIAQGADALIPYEDRLLVNAGSSLGITDAETTTVTPFVGTFDPVTGRRMRGTEANGNLYVATASGVKRLDATSGAPVPAGVPAGLSVIAELNGTSGFLPNDSAIAYRVVWGTRDANGNLLLGAPSSRVVITNTTGGSRNVGVASPIPSGAESGHFWQLYRTAPSEGASIDPGEEYGLVYEAELVLAPGQSAVATVDTLPPTFTGATLYTSPSQEGALAAQYGPPVAKDLAAFRGSMLLLGTTTSASLEVWMLAVDSSGASEGIRDGDTITINGATFTAGATNIVGSRVFARYTAGTPSQNVQQTAANLIYVVNSKPDNPVVVRDMSGVNETPGRLRVEPRDPTASITASVSRAGSWAFTNGQTAAPESHPNELRWSPKGKPDAFPLTAYQRIDGSGDGVRVLALRDSALVIMERGIYRASGDGLSATNAPAITPLDTTTEIVAPDTVVALDNLGFGLSSKGVVQISDQGGVTLLSRPIEDQIRPLLVEPMLSTVRTVAFGVANESEGKFYLWVPESADDTQATKAFVYDHHASLASGEPVWTVRTDDAACGIVHTDGRLYTGTATEVRRERKDLAVTDFADEEISVTVSADTTSNTIPLASTASVEAGDVLAQGAAWGVVVSVGPSSVFLDRVGVFLAGEATVYKAIPSVVEWSPLIPAPGGSAHFQEATFLFRKLGGAAFTAEFATEIVPTYAPVTFDGVAMGLNVTPAAVNLRTWVPRDQQRASRLTVRFTHRQAWSAMQLEGLSVIWTPTSTRVRR